MLLELYTKTSKLYKTFLFAFLLLPYCSLSRIPLIDSFIYFHPRFMTIGEDCDKDRFKSWQLFGVWKLLFCDHRAIKFIQNCGCFTNPCINLVVPPSVTREYHLKLIELLHLLQFNAASLQHTLLTLFRRSTKLSTKSKRLFLQLPTLTPSSTRL